MSAGPMWVVGRSVAKLSETAKSHEDKWIPYN